MIGEIVSQPIIALFWAPLSVSKQGGGGGGGDGGAARGEPPPQAQHMRLAVKSLSS